MNRSHDLINFTMSESQFLSWVPTSMIHMQHIRFRTVINILCQSAAILSAPKSSSINLINFRLISRSCVSEAMLDTWGNN